MKIKQISHVLLLVLVASCRYPLTHSKPEPHLASYENFVVDDEPMSSEQLLLTDDTAQQIVCRRRQGSSLVGDMTYRSPKGEQRMGAFTSGHVGSCEMARRAARNGVVCVERTSGYDAVKMNGHSVIKSFGSRLEDCLTFTRQQDTLKPENSLQLIDPRDLSAYLKNLPNIENPQLNETLHSKNTIWYDENSMVFSYQDSFGNPTGPEGLRANRVAFDVGSTASEPSIRALTEFFELQTFKYPFSITAGRADLENSQAIYFWQPPRDAQGKPIPVAWWKNGSHWHWVFPVGTVFGELMLIRDASATSEWYVHEVRTRVRMLDHWNTDIFRPFTRAVDLAHAVKKFRRNWQETDLKNLVEHLENDDTLTPGKLDSKAYEKAVPSITGYYDSIPETKDYALIRTLLRKIMFRSALNSEWKRSGDKVTYAPTTSASFHIVPKRFIAGLIENNEQSCLRCHNQTGRPLGQLDFRDSLYGEIWGEDEIFTWHPFKPYVEIYSVSDRSRVANPRFIQAGLLIEKKPSPNDNVYRELPRGYVPSYRN